MGRGGLGFLRLCEGLLDSLIGDSYRCDFLPTLLLSLRVCGGSYVRSVRAENWSPSRRKIQCFCGKSSRCFAGFCPENGIEEQDSRFAEGMPNVFVFSTLALSPSHHVPVNLPYCCLPPVKQCTRGISPRIGTGSFQLRSVHGPEPVLPSQPARQLSLVDIRGGSTGVWYRLH